MELVEDFKIEIFIFILFFLQLFKNNFWIFAIISMPATFFHESQHFLTSFLTNGQPSCFSILPSRKNRVLGYVASNNIRWYNGAFISLAPLLNLLPAYILFLNFNNIYSIILSSFLVVGSIPSISDLKMAIRSSRYIILIIPILVFLVNRDIFSEAFFMLK